MSKPKVLFIGELNRSLAEFKEFQQKFECIDYQITTKEQLLEDFKTSLSDIQAIYGAWLGLFLVGGFKDEILQAAPPTLKVIAICSVGHDNYDGKGMKERGIILTNVPSIGAAEPVADLVLYNTLTSFRNLHIYNRTFTPEEDNTVLIRKHLADGKLNAKDGSITLGNSGGYDFGESLVGRRNLSPRNHHVAIIGFGSIGQTIGKKLSDIGMHIHYVKRNELSLEHQAKLSYKATYHKSVADVTSFADLVVVACPGTAETYHLINETVINSFTNPFRIINIGRGSVIDEEALVNGLKSGKVLFAGLDVFEGEPHVHPDLYNRQDVVLTPHIAASTAENFDFTAITAMKSIENVLGGGPGLHIVN